jgi:hypothetical protein
LQLETDDGLRETETDGKRKPSNFHLEILWLSFSKLQDKVLMRFRRLL